MLKLNLLPPSISQKRQMRVAIAMVTILVAAEIGGLVAMRIPKQKKHSELLATQADVSNQLTGLQKVGTDASAVLAEEAKIAPKYDFITGMLTYNQALPDLYQKTAAYTYKEIMFLDMEAEGNQLKMDAYASKPADVGRLLIGLNNSGLFTGLPAVSALPAYSQADEEARKQAELQENNPGSEVIRGYMGDTPGVTAGGYPGGGGYSGGGGGYPGGGGYSGGGGYPGGAPTAGGMGGYPGGGMMKFGGGGYPGGGGMPMAGGMGGYPGGGSTGGYPGSGGGQGGGDIGALGLAGARKQPRGFKITVTGILKTSAKRPSYGTSDQQAGESGKGGGGMGGYPGGGMGGYPGGGMGGYPGGGMGGYSGGGYPGGNTPK